jgi:hypothetical protein
MIMLLMPLAGYLIWHVEARDLIATGFVVMALALFQMTNRTLGGGLPHGHEAMGQAYGRI